MFGSMMSAMGGMGMARVGLVCAAALSLAGVAHGQTIKKGPFGYNSNGHRYVMIQATSWEQARTWARAHGGDLATIDNAAEDAWVFAAFNPGGFKYMLGLAAVDAPGTLTWSDGSTSTYRNWAAGEPNTSVSQKYVAVQNDGKWYVRQTAYAPYYIVEWNAGPIKVPSEYATLEEAFNAMSATGVKDLQIAAGTYVLSNSVGAWVNYTQMGTITGAGTGWTNIITRVTDNAAIILTGKWTIRDLKITRDYGQSALSLNEAPSFMENCVLNGDNSDSGWSLVLYGANGASLNADRCVFQSTNSLFGAAFQTYGFETVTNSIFQGVGEITGTDAPGTFSNCTISGGTAGSTKFAAPAQLYNSIVWNMNGPLGNAVAFNCDIQQSGVAGSGNMNVDPRFMAGTYIPSADSPLIDAGSPTRMLGNGVDVSGWSRVSGAAPDIGAYEYQQTPPPVCGADFNHDGFITFEDFDAFVAAFEAGC